MDHWLRKHGYSSIRKLEELNPTGSTDDKPTEFASENPALIRFNAIFDEERRFSVEDRLSQTNTLQQRVHVASHGFLREFLDQGDVNLHAMWFDIYTGEMYLFSRERQRCVVVNEQTSDELTTEIHRRMDDAAKPQQVQAANSAS